MLNQDQQPSDSVSDEFVRMWNMLHHNDRIELGALASCLQALNGDRVQNSGRLALEAARMLQAPKYSPLFPRADEFYPHDDIPF